MAPSYPGRRRSDAGIAVFQDQTRRGGPCIAVDPWHIVSSASGPARSIRTAREVNDVKSHWILEEIDGAIGGHISAHPGKSAQDVKIACYGLAFAPDIDDLRESPAPEIVRTLAERHAGPLFVVEPHIEALPEGLGSCAQAT